MWEAERVDMRVPVKAVREMRVLFRDAEHVVQHAEAAGLHLTLRDARAIWRGKFEGVEMRSLESFWLLCGWRLKLEAVS